MKVYKTVIIQILFLFILVSCSDEFEDTAVSGKEELREISFTAANTPGLRSASDFWQFFEGFKQGDRIGIFAIEKGWQENGGLGSNKAFAHNKCFYFDGERFHPAMYEDRIFVRNEKLEFYAYYPYSPVMDYRSNLVYTFTVSPFQNREHHDEYPWGYRENNLMTARYTDELNGDLIPLFFQHRMTSVGIDIYHGLDKEASDVVLKRKYIRNHFDIVDPDHRFMIDTTKYDIHMQQIQSAKGISSYIALIPQQVIRKDSLLFSFKVSGVQYNHFGDKNAVLKAGFCNYYKFTLPCTITLTKTTGGTISGEGVYNCGDEIMIRAEQDRGYNFEGWYENGTKASGYMYYSFKANGNRTLEARFKPL